MTSRSVKRQVVYKDWSKGSTFAKGLNTSSDVAQDAYQSTNMQVYSNGTLGVRPWLKNWASTGFTASRNLNTDFKGMHWHPYDSSVDSKTAGFLVLNVTTDTNYSWKYDIGAGTWSAASTFTSGYSTHVDPEVGAGEDYTLVSAGGESTFLTPQKVIYDAFATYSASANTFTAISFATVSGFIPRGSAVYKERVYYYGDVSTPVMIVYSDPAAHETITSASQFFNVGISQGTGNLGVIGAHALRDALMFFTEQGNWFALTGASPVTGSLRQVGQGSTPGYEPGGVVFRNAIWYLDKEANDSGVHIATPQGVDSRTLDYVRPANDFGWEDTRVEPLRGIAADGPDCLILPYLRNTSTVGGDGFQSIDLINNAWGHSSYWNTSLDSGGRGDEQATDLTVADISMVRDKYMFVVTDEENVPSAASTQWAQLYSRDLFLDRPSGTADTYSAKQEFVANDAGGAAQNAAGHLKLAAYTPPTGEEVRVRSVTVDFDYWKDGTVYETPAFTVKTTTTGTGASSEADDTETATAFSGTALSGSKEFARKTFLMGDIAFGAQALVELTGIQSVAIHRIDVEYQARPNTPRD